MTAELTTPAQTRNANLLRSATVLLRLVAFVLIALGCIGGHGLFGWGRSTHADHLGLVVAALLATGLLLVGWTAIDGVSELSRRTPIWVLTGVLTALGISGGLVAAIPIADSMVAFPILAAVGAGSQLTMRPACAVAATSILAIEVGSLAFGFDTGDLAWPVAVVAGLLVGRYRYDARVQRAQAIALFAQSEQTRVQEQRAATLDERARIAREIHDLLAHSLGALGIQIGAAEALLTDAGDIDRAVPLLAQARRLAASGLEETRRAIEALRSDTPPLPESLSSLVDGHRNRHHTQADLTVTGTARPLSPDANLALIRTAQEAMVNAAKHAPCGTVDVSLDYRPDRTMVTVTNQSSLKEPAPSAVMNDHGASGGYGLAGMRERLQLIGGTLTAGPSDRGWTVQAQVPL